MLVFIGGIRSGKSRLAQERFAKDLKGKLWKAAYLATADPKLAAKDGALRARIAAHRASRPAKWLTVEMGANLRLVKGCQAYFLDGLGLWVALKLKERPEAVVTELKSFLKELQSRSRFAVLVLDEVGLGGISVNQAQRRFVDLNGTLNQLVCAHATKVWRVQAGLKTRIK